MTFKAHDKYDSKFYVEADLNYQTLADAQADYQDPAEREKGQFINISMLQESQNAIDAAVTLSVEDAEQLAFHILGLCQSIKGEATAATATISSVKSLENYTTTLKGINDIPLGDLNNFTAEPIKQCNASKEVD